MGDNLEFRIEFLDQSQAAIEIKMRASEARHQYGEVLLFACLALRQTNNMGIHHPVSRSLGGALAWLQDPASPFKVLLGPPEFSRQWINAAMKEGAPDVMANIVSTDIVTLVPFRRQRGKKRFLGTLEFDSGRPSFLLHPKGFDANGGGVNYYAPLSVAVLLRHLACVRKEDTTYQGQLSLVANACGKAIFSGQVTILSQLALAVAIASEAMR
jgi:hypothetical protein